MIGETLGSYRVLSEIGSGGMGVVYQVEHMVLGRKAAVKVLRADMPSDYVERFFNEAKAAASMHHPGLVDVFDFGHHEDGRAYIVMEYLQGESLAERLEHDPRLPVPIACSIARSVATALETAHQQGIVHRDLKPGNIFLIPDNEAAAGVRTKVLDFGIAKLVREREPRGVNTQSGAVIGTPRYMSPEQCKNAKNVDGRSDIYALGCILYEMLLGVAPFDYDSWAELVGAHIYEEPPKPTEIDPKLPADVETLVCKMLEKDPEVRFQSMQALAESLEVVLRAHGAAPVRLTPPGRIATPVRGVHKIESGQDPTVPASAQDLEALKKRPVTDDEQKRAGAAPTISSSTTGEKLPAREAPARKVPWVALGLSVIGLAALGIAGAMVLGKSDDRPTDEPTFVVVDQRASADKPSEAAIADAPVLGIDAGTEPAAAAPIDAGTKTVK
jgi:serine/threonine-protein kinase